MKKSKVVLATLAATVFATSAGALAACGDVPVEEAVGVFSITLDANGGSFSNGESTTTVSTVGGILSAAVETPTYADHTFTGWSLTAGGEIITLGDAGYTFEADVTVYAVWTTSAQPGPGPETPVTYTVTYELNGGTGTAPTQSALEAGATFEVASGAGLSKENHTFGGWSDGTNTYEAGATYTMPASNVTLTAQWTANGDPGPGPGPEIPVTYTVTYELNGGTGTAPTQSALEAGETFEVASGAGLSKENHTFGGWSDGTNTYEAGETYIMPASNVMLTAQWTENDQPGPQPETGAAMTVGGVSRGETFTKKAAADLDVTNGQTGEYYATNVQLHAGDVLAFTVDGQSVNLWRKYDADATQNARNKINTPANPSESSASLTVSENGTYTVSITNWDNAAEWVVWVGTPDGGDEPDPGPDDPQAVPYYLYGNVGGEEKWSQQTGYVFTEVEPDAEEKAYENPVVKKYTVTVTLSTGDYVKIFKINDSVNAWNYNHYEQSWAYAALNDASNLEIKADGEFTFYLKLYQNGGDSVWVSGPTVDIPDPGPDPGTETKADGVYIGDTKVGSLTRNPGNTQKVEYWLGNGVSVDVEVGNQFSLYMGGNKVSAYIESNSSGVEIKSTSTPYDSFKITLDGTLKVYLHKNTNDWSAQFVVTTPVEEVTVSIPDTAAHSDLTFKNGTIRIYVKDGDGNYMTDISGLYLHMWNDDGNYFGEWGTPTSKVAATMSCATKDLTSATGFIVHNNSGKQTRDLSGMEVSGTDEIATYVITYVAGEAGKVERVRVAA